MQAATREVGSKTLLQSATSQSLGANSPVAIYPEHIQSLAVAMEKAIENIVRQGQINEALVKRLLVLEQRVAELTQRLVSHGSRSATSATEISPAPTAGSVPSAITAKDPLPMYVGGSIAMCRVLNSFRMYVDTKDTMFTPQLLLSGIWEPALTRFFMQSLKSGMTVVDVGANVGYYTLLAAASVGTTGRVIAFEPEPRNLEILERNLELNGLRECVTVCGKAVLNERRTLDLHQNPRNRGAHTLFLTDPANSPFQRIKVETIALDDAIDRPVDFMKIDAEGSEPLIFQGMKKTLARNPQLKIMMEFNTVTLKNAGVDPSDFLASLGKLGFTMRVVTPQATLVAAHEQSLLSQQLSTLLLTR